MRIPFIGRKRKNDNMKTWKINIIGNGFDIQHNFKTRYKDFWNYLVKESSKNNHLKLIVESSKSDSGKGPADYWFNLEENINEIIKKWFRQYATLSEEEINKKITGRGTFLNDPRKNFYHVAVQFFRCLTTWINAIDWDGTPREDGYKKPEKRIHYFEKNFFSGSNSNISFNYVDTLRNVYDIQSGTFFIHGQANNRDADIIFGNSRDYHEYEIDKLFEEVCSEVDPDKKSPLCDGAGRRTWNEVFNQAGKERFKKDVKKIIPKLNDWIKFSDFNSAIKSIDKFEINVFGHSLGSLDIVYFEKIQEYILSTSKKFIWNFYYFSESDKLRINAFIESQDINIKNYKLIDSNNIS